MLYTWRSKHSFGPRGDYDCPPPRPALLGLLLLVAVVIISAVTITIISSSVVIIITINHNCIMIVKYYYRLPCDCDPPPASPIMGVTEVSTSDSPSSEHAHLVCPFTVPFV